MASPNRWYVGNPGLQAGVLKANGKGFSQFYRLLMHAFRFNNN